MSIRCAFVRFFACDLCFSVCLSNGRRRKADTIASQLWPRSHTNKVLKSGNRLRQRPADAQGLDFPGQTVAAGLDEQPAQRRLALGGLETRARRFAGKTADRDRKSVV